MSEEAPSAAEPQPPLPAPPPILLIEPGAYIDPTHVLAGEVPAALVIRIGTDCLERMLGFEASGRRVTKGVSFPAEAQATEATFAIDYLSEVVEFIKCFGDGTVTLTLRDDGPLVLTVSVPEPGGSPGRLRFALAPRVDDGGRD